MAKKTVENMVTRVNDVPVTHGQLDAINKQISSLKIAIDKGFSSVEKRFDSLMDDLHSRFAQISAENQRWLAIYEDQDARNKVVMDSQGMIQENFKEHDSRISNLEERVFGIKSK